MDKQGIIGGTFHLRNVLKYHHSFLTAVIMGDSILVTTDGRKLCHVMSTRKRASSASYHNPLTLTNTDSGRRLEKLSVQDLKV